MKNKILLLLFAITFITINSVSAITDNFDRTNSDTLGEGWTELSGSATANANITNNQLIVWDIDGASFINVNRTFTDEGNYFLSLNIKPASTTSLFNIYLFDGANQAIRITSENNNFYYRDNTDTQQVIAANSLNWHNITAEWISSNSVEYCVDTTCVTGQARTAHTTINRVVMGTNVANVAGNNYLDNFTTELTQDRFLTVTAYDNISASSINNFNISLNYENGSLINYTTTTTGTIILNMSSLNNSNYTLFFYSENYKDLNTTIEYLNVTTSYEFKTISTPSINITFYDEITENPINNVSYELLFTEIATTGNTTTGSLYLDLNDTGFLEIVYDNTNYYLRKYFLNITTETDAKLTLYLINKTASNVAEISYTLTDQDGRPLSEAIVKVYRRYVNGQTIVFRPVEMSKSDSLGQGVFHLEKYGPNYRFIVEYNGNIILTTDDNQILSNSITLKSDLSSSVITSTVGNANLQINFSYNPSTLSLSTNYNDPSGITTELCVKIEKIGYRIELINNSCNNGPSGIIVLGITNETGNYRVYAYQETNTAYSTKPAGIFDITISDVKEVIGVSGLFYLLMFSVTGALVGIAVFQNASGTISLTVIGFVMGILFKITEFGWVAGITVVVIGGFLVYVVKQKGVIGT